MCVTHNRNTAFFAAPEPKGMESYRSENYLMDNQMEFYFSGRNRFSKLLQKMSVV